MDVLSANEAKIHFELSFPHASHVIYWKGMSIRI